MSLYFVQHGSAFPKEVDPDRSLTEAGRLEVERVGAALRHMGLSLRGIYHSGKRRAQETAELLAAETGLDYAAARSGMSPNDDPVAFVESIEEECMYVGHLPHLGKVVSYLATGAADADVVQFSNGGIVCLDRGDAGYHIKWYLIPAFYSAQ